MLCKGIGKKALPTSLLCVMVHMMPLPIIAQALHDLGTETAPWHAAVQVRARLDAGSTDRQLIRRAAELELEIGLPGRALRVLRNHAGPDSLWDVGLFELRGEAEYALGRFAAAASSFMSAAELAEGARVGLLEARIGNALELSGQVSSAPEYYARAGGSLPQISGWLAVREARLTSDTARAFLLLENAQPEAESLGRRARGDILVRVGDTTSAITEYEAGGFLVKAATLALAIGDSVRGRRLTYESTNSADTAMVRVGIEMARGSFPPRTPEEYVRLAESLRSLRSPREAVRFAEGAVNAANPTAATLVFWADLLAETRNRTAALEVYGRAAEMDGPDGRDAAFQHGRMLLLLGQSAAGMAELSEFVESYPDHSSAPRAMYAMADRRQRERLMRAADSLSEEVVVRWPRNSYATNARSVLAGNALARADTAAAIEWYRQETELGGSGSRFAQYRLGELQAAGGDSLAARGTWAALARSDSLGYYGTIARNAAGLPPMNLDPIAPHQSASDEVQETLGLLDLLNESLFEEETELLVSAILEDRTKPATELLSLAEGLIERGYVLEGIRLGWIAAGSQTLNHPRVLRAVFPWPHRELIELEARELGLDPYLLAAMIRQESAFVPTAVSRAGARGLMQLMPPTAREVARRIGAEWDDALLSVADANLHLGGTHLAGLLRHYDGRIVLTLAAYNAGGGRVRRWLASLDADDPIAFVEQIPFVETRGYLRTVLRNRVLYEALYPPAQPGAAATP